VAEAAAEEEAMAMEGEAQSMEEKAGGKVAAVEEVAVAPIKQGVWAVRDSGQVHRGSQAFDPCRAKPEHHTTLTLDPTINASQRIERPADADLTAFLVKVGTTLEQVKSATVLRWASMGINDADCNIISYLIASGAMANLTTLELSYNQIGDAGVEALAKAFASGALANVKTLGLSGNQIGDEGMQALTDALSRGAMASLTTIFVDSPNHPALKAACQARGIKIDRF